jgi:hypothetical protein
MERVIGNRIEGAGGGGGGGRIAIVRGRRDLVTMRGGKEIYNINSD